MMIINQENLDKYKNYLIARGQSLNYHNIMRIWLQYCETNNLIPAQITQEDITKFFMSDKTYSKNSKNQFIKANRHYSKFMEQDKTAWQDIRLLAVERKIPSYLSEQDLEEAKAAIINYHSKMIPIPKIRALLDFLFYSGARKNEILTLKRIDIDIEANTAKVYGKGQKERLVYYPKAVAKEIQTYFSCEAEEINAFNISIGQIHYLMKLITKYTGKKVYTHLWRHSGARYMIRKGIPIGVVSKILGHSNLTTTMIYTDPDEEMVRTMYKEKIQ